MPDTESDTSAGKVCPACGSANLRHRIYGLPTAETAETVARDPNLELGGCMISPEFWMTKCNDCGHEVTLGEAGMFSAERRPTTERRRAKVSA